MFTIIRRLALLELRDHVEALQSANAGLTRKAEEAETAAAAAVRNRITCLNRQLFQAGENNVALSAEFRLVQAEQYAGGYGLPVRGGRLYTRGVVDDVQRYMLTCVQDSAAFGETGDGDRTRGATVSIKR